MYESADLVTYPSYYEGFGNAFLEAIYFRKPLVVNRYSIFIRDIEPKGFDVVTFEMFITDSVVEQVRSMLEPDRCRKAVEENYRLCLKYSLLRSSGAKNPAAGRIFQLMKPR